VPRGQSGQPLAPRLTDTLDRRLAEVVPDGIFKPPHKITKQIEVNAVKA
jgi:hypothetical protein